jgi:hypothetical protein
VTRHRRTNKLSLQPLRSWLKILILIDALCRWLDDKRPGCSLQYELWPDTGDKQQQKCRTACSWELVLYTGDQDAIRFASCDRPPVKQHQASICMAAPGSQLWQPSTSMLQQSVVY